MLKVKEAVIVEGKYDKQRLSEFLSATIIPTSGFRVFKDKEKQRLIRKLAEEQGIVVMTDSDKAGLVIRNFLKGIVPLDKIKQCYVPQIAGKEKRKSETSKEGLLGVEGLSHQVLYDALLACGADVGQDVQQNKPSEPMTKGDMFEMGLSGRENSAVLRKRLMESLGLPTYLSCNALLDVINTLYSKEEILDKLQSI
ncbi:MAG: DUF4093 domain-containing protein [Ruminococcus sp.]|nr:DUF4093 domain-containing protein [Ruminococcus sp.]